MHAHSFQALQDEFSIWSVGQSIRLHTGSDRALAAQISSELREEAGTESGLRPIDNGTTRNVGKVARAQRHVWSGAPQHLGSGDYFIVIVEREAQRRPACPGF